MLRKTLITLIFLTPIFCCISQNTKTDKILVSKKAISSMMRDSLKKEELEKLVKSKDSIINSLAFNNIEYLKNYNLLTERINIIKEDKTNLEKDLNKAIKKRFNIGPFIGLYLDSELNTKPVLGVGLTYSLFNF